MDHSETVSRPVQADLRAVDALPDVSRVLMGIALRAVAAAPVALTVPQHRVAALLDGVARVPGGAHGLAGALEELSAAIGRHPITGDSAV